MKKLVLVLLLGAGLLLVACGPQEPIVEVLASAINLESADLGSAFSLEEESDLAEILGRTAIAAEDSAPLLDANRRVFIKEAAITDTVPLTRTQVILTVMVYDAAGAAKTGLNEARDALKPVVATQQVALVEAKEAAPVGDQSELWAAELPQRQAKVYLFLGRRLNVLVVVMVTGPSDLTPAWVVGLGQTLISRVPAATAR